MYPKHPKGHHLTPLPLGKNWYSQGLGRQAAHWEVYSALVTVELSASKREDTTFWVYCHKCWVPFQEPCMHPPLCQSALADHQSCPYGSQIPFILPSVVTVIQESKVVVDGRSKNPYIDRIAQRLGINAIQFASIKSLQTWIKHEPKDAEFQALPPASTSSAQLQEDIHMEDVQMNATSDAQMSDALS
ncbi:hypothetical protein EV702DRAFT_1042432 [Suillus placidus]|uniref:Uncharacterized protein n=1 Tax=Suillus placidus TaxID=48579 RepID=A0A9P7A4J1_9AGAM|nr:hypothetical protein EV702DRAFT_1042432 [Suillus placidus]